MHECEHVIVCVPVCAKDWSPYRLGRYLTTKLLLYNFFNNML